MYKRIEAELEPFLNGIRTKEADWELFNGAYGDFKARFANVIRIKNLIEKEGSTVDFSKVERTGEINALFLFLGYAEGLGNCFADILSMLLVANGRDFHIESRSTPRIKHVVSMNDLEKERVPLRTKLNFLEDNGVTVLNSIIDTDLRNRIAHLNFRVEKDKVYVKGKPGWESIMNNIRILLAAFMRIDVLLAKARAKALNP